MALVMMTMVFMLLKKTKHQNAPHIFLVQVIKELLALFLLRPNAAKEEGFRRLNRAFGSVIWPLNHIQNADAFYTVNPPSTTKV
jgi:hypothetical protein